jgi:imidazolonepropionase-like amidohydrolase
VNPGTTTPALHLRGPVLVGPDDVQPEAWVLDGRITFERPVSVDLTAIDGWVLPGLVDAHCHLGLGPGGAVSDEETERQALADRAGGSLLLRDAGSAADTRWVQQRDDLPELIRAGRHLARDRRYIPGYAAEIDPADLVEEVRVQARRGDGWVKLVGDWIDRGVGDLTACWPADVARAAIAAAHEEGARVTAHCFAETSLRDLAEAGIDCVEHASGLTDDTLPLFAERGVAIVPTLFNIGTFPEIAAAGEAKFPAYAAHMRALHARRYETIRNAYDAGIAIYAGTDAGGSIPHGIVASELDELAKTGMPVLDVLGAATWRAREWLGRPGLTEGAPADLVVYAGDPRADLSVLHDPQTIVLRGTIRAASPES